jgi:basic membrane protein A and related proteins
MQDGSFLVGAAAALKSRSRVVGFVGGEPSGVEASQAGYQAGVAYIDRQKGIKTRVLVDYTTPAGDNVAKGKQLALKQISHGADVVYHDADVAGGGVIEACAAKQRYAIGNYFDASQWVPADERKWILTSMVLRVDNAIVDGIEAYRDGSIKGAGSVYLGLAEGGVDYAQNQYNKSLLDDIPLTLEDIRKKIISGAIHVPEKPAG